MAKSDSPSRPNVVFFMVDQLSAKWFEAARSGACPTPSLDRLCASGVTFTHAITSNPVCCPARATIATGMTSRGHGVLQNSYELDPSLPTFMWALQQAGYRTGALGKVHFHAHFHGLYPDYRPYGYDVVHNTEDPRGGEWLDWVRSEHPEHFEGALAQIWATGIPEFAEYGPGKENLRDRILEVRKRWKWATPEHPEATWAFAPLTVPPEVSQTEWITRRGMDFIAAAPPDRPFHAHISYVQPHGPFYPPAEYLKCVDAARIPDPAPAEWVEDPYAPRYFADKEPVRWGCDCRKVRQYYFADIAHLDAQLGRVMAALEQTGRMDDTYIFFLSDHGEMLGDHGSRGKEEKHYDACIRIPLVIAGPGLRSGAVCDEIVQLEDICPTVLEMAFLPHPRLPKMGPYLRTGADPLPSLPGRSLLPLCRGETPDGWRTAAYCESYNTITSADPMDWARTIRTKEYRYTMYPCGGGEQLFHIRKDPREQHNLVADPAHAAIRQELRDRLLEMIILQDYPHPFRELFAIGVH